MASHKPDTHLEMFICRVLSLNDMFHFKEV